MNVLQAAPCIVCTSALAGALISEDLLYMYFAAGAIVLGSGVNYAVKGLCKAVAGNVELFKRPNPPQSGCGNFANCTAGGSTTFGFPSGHAQIVAFSAAFWSLYLQKYGKRKSTSVVSICILWALVLLVCWSRIKIGCHNLIQVTAGTTIGAGLGVAYFKFLDRVYIRKPHLAIAERYSG